MNEQLTVFSDNAEYDVFVDKFKHKLTTDDCYTPPEIFNAVVGWACDEYGIDKSKIVRPFYPGGDYENFEYPEDCVVLDNPPFSILSSILEFYLDRQIAFFLFAPSLTALSSRSTCMRCCHVITDCGVTYENGAVVRTSFVTSLEKGVVLRSAPGLGKIVNEANKRRLMMTKAKLPQYEYPDHVVTAAMVQRYSKYGVDYVVRVEECVQIAAMDQQRQFRKAIFGCGLLLSEKAAAEKAAAEKAAAEKAEKIIWKLSTRELEMIKQLGEN